MQITGRNKRPDRCRVEIAGEIYSLHILQRVNAAVQSLTSSSDIDIVSVEPYTHSCSKDLLLLSNLRYSLTITESKEAFITMPYIYIPADFVWRRKLRDFLRELYMPDFIGSYWSISFRRYHLNENEKEGGTWQELYLTNLYYIQIDK